MAVDAGKRVVVVGTASGDEHDWWVATYDAEGTWLWEHATSDPFSDRATEVVVDATGDYFVAGDNVVDKSSQPAYLHREVMLRRYSPDGTPIWYLDFPHQDPIDESVVGLAQQRDGTLIVVSHAYFETSTTAVVRHIDDDGQPQSTVEVAWAEDQSPSALAATVLPGIGADIIAVGGASGARWASRFTQTGDVLWTRTWSCGSETCLLYDVVGTGTDPVVVGDVRGVSFWDAWVAALDGDGEPSWEVSVGVADNNESAHGVATAPDGSIVVVFSTAPPGTQQFDGGVRKLSASGDLEWHSTLQHEVNGGSVTLRDVAIDPECGGIWIVGREWLEEDSAAMIAKLAP